MSKEKCAILLTGHFRHYKKCYKSFFQNVISPLKERFDVDIFVSSWTKLNTSDSCAHHYLGFKDFGDANLLDLEDVGRIYSPLSLEIEKFENIKEKFLFDNIFTEAKREDFATFTIKDDIFLLAPLFYKWFKCNELKKKQEAKQGFVYDFVIKTRPDIFFFEKLDITKIEKEKFLFYLSHTDIFVGAASERMDFYCDVFHHLERIAKDYKGLTPIPWKAETKYYAEFFSEWRLIEGDLLSYQKNELGERFCYFYHSKKAFSLHCRKLHLKPQKELIH